MSGYYFQFGLWCHLFAGFKLGFWFAQQGSMYVFVIIIFIYVYLINSLDRVYKKEKDN